MAYRSFKIRIFVFALIFSVGFIIGSVFQASDNIRPVITEYSRNLLVSRINVDSLHVFLESLVINLLILIFVLLVSISQVGILLDSFIILCYGIGFGAIISNIVCDSGIHGLGFSVMLLFPGYITSVIAILMLSASFFKSSQKKYALSFRNKCFVLLTYMILIVFSAGLDVTSAVIYNALN